MNDAGAAVSGASSPQPVGGVGQPGGGFEGECAAVAGLPGPCPAGMIQKTCHKVHSRRSPVGIKTAIAPKTARSPLRREGSAASSAGPCRPGRRSARTPTERAAEWRISARAEPIRTAARRRLPPHGGDPRPQRLSGCETAPQRHCGIRKLIHPFLPINIQETSRAAIFTLR